MARSVLSRYLDPVTLGRVASRTLEPRGLVMGNLAGAHKSPMAGFAVEFAGHREYVPGDDPRHIDWRLYFTRDRYFIKQYEMETNFVCHLVLDVSASMRYGQGGQQKLDYAAKMASTLGFSIIRQNDKVSLATFDDRVRGFIQPSNSMAQVIRMTEHLDETEPVEKTDMSACLTELAWSNAAPRDRRGSSATLHGSLTAWSRSETAALQPARSRPVPDAASRRAELQLRRHGPLRRPGSPRPVADADRRHPPSLPRRSRRPPRTVRHVVPAKPNRTSRSRHQPRHGRSPDRLSEYKKPA